MGLAHRFDHFNGCDGIKAAGRVAVILEHQFTLFFEAFGFHALLGKFQLLP